MEMNFCRRCGEALQHATNHVYSCQNDHTIFKNASPTVGIFLLDKNNQLVLPARGIEPHIGTVDTVGGFVDENETLEDALYRELSEESGLSRDDITAPQYLMSYSGSYRYENEDIPVLATFFWAKLVSNKSPVPKDDVERYIVCSFSKTSQLNLYPGGVSMALDQLQEIVEN